MPEQQPDKPAAKPRPKFVVKRPTETSASPASIPIEKAPRSQEATGGSFLHKLLWLGLIAWLLILAFMLLDPLAFLFPDDDTVGSWWHVESGAPEVVPEAPPDETPGEEHPSLTALRQVVAAGIVSNDLSGVMALVQQQKRRPSLYPYPDALSQLATALTAVRNVNTTVADRIREHIDEQVVLNVRGRSITIVPRASAGERVNVFVVTPQTNRPPRSATFGITDLDPIERARWLGEADTPRICLMKLHLHLQADDHESARAFAPGCGPLADALIQQLESAAQ
ncbi:MAG: hypothetical protein QGH29_11205 [Kiritimatiellia bacterium]|nr:hypothetical protein [Kiritimatiellia bacterium]